MPVVFVRLPNISCTTGVTQQSYGDPNALSQDMFDVTENELVGV